LLRAARKLRRGGLLAHNTGTLPGVASVAGKRAAAIRLCRFKQRKGPFLLLADSLHSALRLLIFLPSELRRAMQQAWPGPTTFIFPTSDGAVSGLSSICYGGRRMMRRTIAVRVDADPACRYLAYLAGGLLVSSSLNRKGQPVQAPDRRLRMRWQRHLSAYLTFSAGSGCASTLLKWTGSRLLPLSRFVAGRN